MNKKGGEGIKESLRVGCALFFLFFKKQRNFTIKEKITMLRG